MKFDDVYIPYGSYWTTPFAKWQGAFAGMEPIPFAAATARRALDERAIDADRIDGVVLGTTIPSHHAFYGAPWLAGMIGIESATGPTIAQACATSARCLTQAAADIAAGGSRAQLVVTADRTSNGPHLYYPDPAGIGGTGVHENWVLDNFGHDPFAKNAMVDTAEKVAAKLEISREEQDSVALLRHDQYQQALADDRSFQRKYMLDEVAVTDARGKVRATVTGDDGVFPTTREGLEKLRPMTPGGTVTFGSQTHPADGNAGALVTDKDTARDLSRDGVTVRLLAAGQARVEKGLMPLANVPAVQRCLASAGVALSDVSAITTHTPFAVNDIALSRELGIDVTSMNAMGCSLVWGHPQAPTGLRSVIELIEQLVVDGGGIGLFTGCAAGDSAMALLVRVDP